MTETQHPTTPYDRAISLLDEAHEKIVEAAGAIISNVGLDSRLEQGHRFRGCELAVELMVKAADLRVLRKRIDVANDNIDPPF